MTHPGLDFLLETQVGASEFRMHTLLSKAKTADDHERMVRFCVIPKHAHAQGYIYIYILYMLYIYIYIYLHMHMHAQAVAQSCHLSEDPDVPARSSKTGTLTQPHAQLEVITVPTCNEPLWLL